jgi:toxin CptA
MRSSNESSNCRIDWRPSRALVLALAALGLLAAIALALSDMPRAASAPAGALALAYGLWLARREWRKPAHVVAWNELVEARAVFRGALVTVTGLDRNGLRQRWNWWPDTLSDAARRRLRLAAHRVRSE